MARIMGCGFSVFDGLFCYNNVMEIILDGIKYAVKSMVLFWCPFGRASRKEYVYGMRAPGVVAFIAIIIMLFLPPHKMEQALALINEYQVALYSVCAVALVGSWTLLVRRGHDLGYSGPATFRRCLNYWRFSNWQFYSQQLMGQEGSPLPNEYGPAPKENLL